MESELDLDLGLLLTCDKMELQAYTDARQMTDDHLITLAAYLEEVGLGLRVGRSDNAYAHFRTAILLLEIVDDRSTIFSMDRAIKLDQLRELLG